jgi:hypothetical protein
VFTGKSKFKKKEKANTVDALQKNGPGNQVGR